MIRFYAFRCFEKKHLGLVGAVVISVLLTAGCSRSPCVVNGTVLVNGAPAKGVYVVLHSADGQTAGSGCTVEDGSFRLTVPQAGEYPVTCFFPKITKVMDDIIEGEDQLRGRYRDWQKPAANVSLQAGDNTVPTINLR